MAWTNPTPPRPAETLGAGRPPHAPGFRSIGEVLRDIAGPHPTDVIRALNDATRQLEVAAELLASAGCPETAKQLTRAVERHRALLARTQSTNGQEEGR